MSLLFDWWSVEKLLDGYTGDKEVVVSRLIELENQDNEFAQAEIEMIIDDLYDKQIDPITSGFNYGQREIIRHLKKLR